MTGSPGPLASPTGEVITFYSYKGGTGRTMALANIAWLLAGAGQRTTRVLMVDWDLEAPGLHRFFHDSFTQSLGEVADTQRALDERQGLLELLTRVRDTINKTTPPKSVQCQDAADALLTKLDLAPFIIRTDNPRLDLLKAGQQNDSYAHRINTFDWEGLFNRSPWLFRALADRLARDYRYVLVDSRTGETDTSGICTRMLPQKLVVVFTPNRQSLTGVDRLVRKAVAYRRDSEDPRPLAVFPLPSRVDSTYRTMVTDWREGNASLNLVGYRPQFEGLLKDVYSLEPCDLREYFNEVEIQYIPEYSFGEQIAVRAEATGPRLSFAKSYETFARWLVERAGPWEDSALLKARAAQEEQRKAKRKADEQARQSSVKFDEIWASLTPEEQSQARRVLTRLVEVPRDDGSLKALSVDPGEFDPADRPVLERLQGLTWLRSEASGQAGGPPIQLNDDLLQWSRLRDWCRQDRAFLLWRQKLRLELATWVSHQRKRTGLLAGGALGEARRWLRTRAPDLNALERDFIAQSTARGRLIQAATAAAAALALGFALYTPNTGSDRDRTTLLAARTSQDPLETVLLLEALGRVSGDANDLAAHIAASILPVAVLRDFPAPASMRFDSTGQRIVAVAHDGAMAVWPADGRGSRVDLPAPADGSSPIAATFVSSPPQALVRLLLSDGTFALWHTQDRSGARRDGSVREIGAGRLERAQFSADGQSFVALSGKGDIVSGPVGAGSALLRLPRTELKDAAISNGHAVIAAVTDRQLLARLRDGSIVKQEQTRMLDGVRISGNGSRAVAIASYSGAILIWDLLNLARTAIGRPADPASGAALNDDGTLAAIGYQDGRVEIWELSPHWAMRTTLLGHAGPVGSIAFDHSGSRVVTASDDGTARVWMLNRKRLPESLSGKALIDSLRASTTACLTPTQRLRSDIDADSLSATRDYLACETSYGREGSSPSSPVTRAVAK